ncbi:uncharacterized protein LOC134193629 [Corticium candelabrum]|uniref:uncharacterized protein LOC134193629 n=1 Tax=Corticium candelabrum TaxID=121492 RepID=UPI002E25A6E3|nr:uncharacterized protein LOC134193629 [Corticium candelabrum]
MVLEEAPVGVGDIQQASKEDSLLSSVMQRVLTNGWNECSQSEESYYLVRDQLTVVDDTLLLGNGVVIPEALCRSVLRLAHEGHPGLEAFQDTLRTLVWGPGITEDANIFAEQCDICWRRRPNPSQQFQPSDLKAVWNKLAMALVTIEGISFLSIIDYGSRFSEVLPLEDSMAKGVIKNSWKYLHDFTCPLFWYQTSVPSLLPVR